MLPEGIECSSVIINTAQVAYEAVNYIIEYGHTKIAVICGPEDIYSAQERLKGYLNACHDKQISLNPEYIIHGKYDLLGGYEATQKLLDMENPPTAVLATNGEITDGVLMNLNERGVIIGKDISVVGFDNLTSANLVNPKISVVVQPLQKIGETAADLLLNQLSGKDNTIKIIKLKAELIRQFSVCQI